MNNSVIHTNVHSCLQVCSVMSRGQTSEQHPATLDRFSSHLEHIETPMHRLYKTLQLLCNRLSPRSLDLKCHRCMFVHEGVC